MTQPCSINLGGGLRRWIPWVILLVSQLFLHAHFLIAEMRIKYEPAEKESRDTRAAKQEPSNRGRLSSINYLCIVNFPPACLCKCLWPHHTQAVMRRSDRTKTLVGEINYVLPAQCVSSLMHLHFKHEGWDFYPEEAVLSRKKKSQSRALWQDHNSSQAFFFFLFVFFLFVYYHQ